MVVLHEFRCSGLETPSVALPPIYFQVSIPLFRLDSPMTSPIDGLLISVRATAPN
jgi:hypothetical protein